MKRQRISVNSTAGLGSRAMARALLLPRFAVTTALVCCMAFIAPLAGCSQGNSGQEQGSTAAASAGSSAIEGVDESSLAELSWTGSPSVEVNDNSPEFTDDELSLPAGTEEYGKLDEEKRCTTAMACVGEETMSNEKRGAISSVHPTGWVQASYSFLSSDHLYERCHLIAYCLTAENANKRNLITGTHYLNISGMLPYEEEVLNYVRDTSNHVIYEVTPVFEGDDLVAKGVHMQAQSVEDDGAGVSFNVFCFNVEPGIIIDYATGESEEAQGSTSSTGGSYSYSSSGGSSSYTYSKRSSSSSSSTLDNSSASGKSGSSSANGSDDSVQSYVLNTSSKKFHKPGCSGAQNMLEKNKKSYEGIRAELIDQGYSPCGICKP